MEKKNIVPILEKAIDIMEYLGAAPDPVSQPELQKALHIPQATCYRIVTTLVERGWLEKRGAKHFDIAAGLAAITEKTGLRLEKYRKLQPLMNRIVAEAGFSAKFSIRDGTEFINVCTAKNRSEAVVFSEVGFRAPLGRPASVSTIFLAELTEEEQLRMVGPDHCSAFRENLAFYRRHGSSFQNGSASPRADYHFDTLSFPVRFNGRLIGVLSLLSLPGILERKMHETASRILAILPELAEKGDL